MDQARIDIFLDDGWSLIDKLHEWLSSATPESNARTTLNELIRELQRIWETADDLQLNRLARTILALEQILERICARSLMLNGEKAQHLASGIEGLQELLLGFEATREEPDFANLDALVRIEQFARQTFKNENDNSIVVINPEPSASSQESTAVDSNSEITIAPATNPVSDIWSPLTAIDSSRVVLLEQFTANLEDSCHRLLERIQADEAPYATTVSRLEHLAETTHDLAEQIVVEARQMSPAYVAPENQMLTNEFAFGEQPRGIEISLTEMQTESASAVDDTSEPRQLPGLPPVAEWSEPIVDTGIAEVEADAPRVLIVEESLFYRNLLLVAVQSAGYLAQVAESAAQGVSLLQRTADIRAVLIGSTISPILACAIEQCRRSMNLKVIGMTLPGREKIPVSNLDAKVSKMHPQQLVLELERLLDCSAVRARKSA